LSRSGNGTGLGLAIAKELVHNMRGEIRAFAEDGFLCIEIRLTGGVK
jgi:signal transduction histidine kinase